MTEPRLSVSSQSSLEERIGFSRAVRVGPFVAVSGTAPIADDGTTAHPGDLYAQTRRCLAISVQALEQVGVRVEDIVRTRIMLTDMTRWEEAARAHGEVFGHVRPACTFVEVKGFIRDDWLVETELDGAMAADGENMSRTDSRQNRKRPAKKARSRKPTKAQISAMIEEATVDAYDESEQMTGFLTMFEDNLKLPFETHILGSDVTVEDIGLSDRNDVFVVCSSGKHRQRISILDLPIPEPPPAGWEWIEAYRQWAQLAG